MKKVYANFGFPSLNVPETQAGTSTEFDTLLIPSVALEKIAMRQSIIFAEEKEMKFIAISDPIGESLMIAELIDNHWFIYESYQLAAILIDYLVAVSSVKEDSSENKEYVVICEQNE